jgi:amino acid transporter
MQGGKQYENLSEGLKLSYTAWTTSPAIGSFHFVADLPALFIIILITALVYRGMKESRNASNVMVVVKLCIILLVIAVGVFYVDMDNWTLCANGVTGVLKEYQRFSLPILVLMLFQPPQKNARIHSGIYRVV